MSQTESRLSEKAAFGLYATAFILAGFIFPIAHHLFGRSHVADDEMTEEEQYTWLWVGGVILTFALVIVGSAAGSSWNYVLLAADVLLGIVHFGYCCVRHAFAEEERICD